MKKAGTKLDGHNMPLVSEILITLAEAQQHLHLGLCMVLT